MTDSRSHYPKRVNSRDGSQFMDVEGLLEFISFGLDRAFPDWVPFDHRGTILHIGPGERKQLHGAGGNVTDLDWPGYDADRDTIPFPNNSVGGIVVTHVLEHLHDPRYFLSEAARVLLPGAALSILVPHGQSLLYLQDLDHRTPFTVDTWRTFLGNQYYEKSGGRHLHLEIGVNVLFGLKEENLCLITQLVKSRISASR